MKYPMSQSDKYSISFTSLLVLLAQVVTSAQEEIGQISKQNPKMTQWLCFQSCSLPWVREQSLASKLFLIRWSEGLSLGSPTHLEFNWVKRQHF